MIFDEIRGGPKLPPGKKIQAETTVSAGQTSAPVILPTNRFNPSTIGAYPGAGGSALVEYTLSSNERISNSTAVWHEWSAGTVSDNTVNGLISGITAIRLSAITADAIFEIVS